MKHKIYWLIAIACIFFTSSCRDNSNPENAATVNNDSLAATSPKAMDSLEQAIFNQMSELDSDTSLTDSTEN